MELVLCVFARPQVLDMSKLHITEYAENNRLASVQNILKTQDVVCDETKVPAKCV